MSKSCFIEFKSEKNSALPNEELNVLIQNICRVLHTFWLKGGPMPPLGFAKGGHFEVKDGYLDFLQIT